MPRRSRSCLRQIKAELPLRAATNRTRRGDGHNAPATPSKPHASKKSFNQKETQMNWYRIEGSWRQFKGNARVRWGKLTGNQLDAFAGERDVLAGKTQEAYGIAKDGAQKLLVTRGSGQGSSS
jgi:uncharacterized protein YjbJ (UPF0337 family)